MCNSLLVQKTNVWRQFPYTAIVWATFTVWATSFACWQGPHCPSITKSSTIQVNLFLIPFGCKTISFRGGFHSQKRACQSSERGTYFSGPTTWLSECATSFPLKWVVCSRGSFLTCERLQTSNSMSISTISMHIWPHFTEKNATHFI